MISELVNSGFSFSFFYFKISEFCDSEVLFSLNAHPTPYSLLKLSFGSNWIQKTKISIYEISRMLFSNMDFNFAHFAHSNFSHLEIEQSFGLFWVKLQNGRFHLQMSIVGI